MRLYSIMLPGTTALLTCVCSFSVSHQMNFNVTTGAHSDVHDDDNVAASGFMIAQNSTSMEERVSQSIAISVTNKIMEALHVSQDTYMLTPDAWTHLKRLDRHVVMSFVENEKHRSLSMLNKKNDRAVRSWILRQVHEATASAERLRQAIKDHISTTHGLEIHSELLDSWMAGGGAAECMPLLSIAKESHIIENIAKKIQEEILMGWARQDVTVDAVFDMLKLSDLTERGLTYENLDTFSQYIEVHNERNPRAKTDTFTYLRNKFGGGKLGVMVLKGMNEPRFADEGFVSNAVGNDKPPVDFIGSLLSITVDVRDVEKLLDPLLAVFGGVAKLAPFLAALKKSGTSRHQAEQVQNAMLKRWLVRNTKLDAVFDMLELSELMEKGLTYENLDTFSQYIEVHNERNPRAKTDTFTYLRNKFGDGKLTVMVLKGMKVPQFADEGFVFNEVGNYQLVANFIDGLLSVVVGVENLLDPLLAAFGDAAKLLTVLKIVKESGICRHEAEQLQRALLTRVAYERGGQ